MSIRSKTPSWRECAFVTVQEGAKILGLSAASIYRLEREKRLLLKRIAGRTLIDVPSLSRLLASAEDYQPTTRANKANAARRNSGDKE